MMMMMMMVVVMEDLRQPTNGWIVQTDFRRQLLRSGEHFGNAAVKVVGYLY